MYNSKSIDKKPKEIELFWKLDGEILKSYRTLTP